MRLNPPLQTEVAGCYNSVIYEERVNYDIQTKINKQIFLKKVRFLVTLLFLTCPNGTF